MQPDTADTNKGQGDSMSAVAMTSGPTQRRVTHGEDRSHLSPVDVLDGTDIQHLDLCALARHAVALLHATGRVERSRVRVELPDEPVFARTSRRRLEQVLLQLVPQAVEAQGNKELPARAVRLTVEPPDDFEDYGPTLRVRYSAAEGKSRVDLKEVDELVEALGGQLTEKRLGLTGITVTVELPESTPEPGTASW
jgi:hypothetical protein